MARSKPHACGILERARSRGRESHGYTLKARQIGDEVGSFNNVFASRQTDAENSDCVAYAQMGCLPCGRRLQRNGSDRSRLGLNHLPLHRVDKYLRLVKRKPKFTHHQGNSGKLVIGHQGVGNEILAAT